MNAAVRMQTLAQSQAEIITRDPRWTSILARDAAADGTFFYSVRTTGLYCRPSCAARPARPENIAFHADRTAAERAGFRPCRRCKPDRPAARDLMPHAAIGFATAQCSLGVVLVAAGERGICAIAIGDSAGQLEHELEEQFPSASITAAGTTFDAAIGQIIALIDAPATASNLALDIRGTPFQRKVWDALRRIPAGATASYAGVAARIGAPDSARAVAQACAANRLAIVIPCHRVVRSDGSLSGYRWGVERKRALLAREAHA